MQVQRLRGPMRHRDFVIVVCAYGEQFKVVMVFKGNDTVRRAAMGARESEGDMIIFSCRAELVAGRLAGWSRGTRIGRCVDRTFSPSLPWNGIWKLVIEFGAFVLVFGWIVGVRNWQQEREGLQEYPSENECVAE